MRVYVCECVCVFGSASRRVYVFTGNCCPWRFVAVLLGNPLYCNVLYCRQPVASNRKPGPCSALFLPSTGLVSSTSQEGKALQLRLEYSKLNKSPDRIFLHAPALVLLQLHFNMHLKLSG